MSEVNYMHCQEFIDGGYLHELNRLLLHPLGLALQVEPREDGHFHGKIWDYRDEPEGILFAGDTLLAEKAERVAEQMFARRQARAEALGYVIQPVDTEKPTLTTTYIDPAERTRQRARPA